MTTLSFGWKDSFKKKMGAAATAARIAATKGMRLTEGELKGTVRSQILAGGLGDRVAKSVRSVTYPKGAKTSLHPAATVFFKAPHIIRAFDEGSLIRPRNGSRMLAIPTPECPKGPRGRALRPDEAESRYGEGHAYQAASGVVVLEFFVTQALSTKRPGYRRATIGRARKGREGAWVAFYFLIQSARLPKKLDLTGALARAGIRLTQNIAAAWPHEVEEL